jgi:tRNA threonylcarbamoyl adenosine modification protein (Sua5/YciO/YrdC/YwlC family)
VSDPIDDAAEAIRRGALVVMPTDTVYGIGARPDDPRATAALFEAKGRSRELELPVLVPLLEDAERIAAFDRRARDLADKHWPGALTIVVPRCAASRGWDLGGDPGTIGVRMPDHPTTLSLLARTGPLAVTSANRSGHPTPATCEELRSVFDDAVAVYLCDPKPLAGLASTVVDLTGDARILRQGSVTFGWTHNWAGRRDEVDC